MVYLSAGIRGSLVATLRSTHGRPALLSHAQVVAHYTGLEKTRSKQDLFTTKLGVPETC